jgi:hypothetical protein
LSCKYCNATYLASTRGGKIKLRPDRAGTPRLNGFTLQELVLMFGKSSTALEHCYDPAKAALRCKDKSEDFLDFIACAKHSTCFPSDGYSLIRLFGNRMPGMSDPSATHSIARVGNLYYDWTARQFDPTLPVPRIYDGLSELLTDWETARVEEYDGEKFPRESRQQIASFSDREAIAFVQLQYDPSLATDVTSLSVA